MKTTAISPANIAFIKFWGKKDPELNLPFNNSISMNLDGCLTTTTVEFSPRFSTDEVFIDGRKVRGEKKERVIKILNIVRKKSSLFWNSKVFSKNSFPSSSGIASSASAFSALALAASKSAGLNLTQKEISILARLGSGSASRSIIDGFAEWLKGRSSNSSYAIQIAPPTYWDIRDIVAVVENKAKRVSSTQGHQLAQTSPFFKTRLRLLPERIKLFKEAFFKKDFEKFGEILEQEAVELHTIAMTSRPCIFYLNSGSLVVIERVRRWRKEGILCYFTLDAGANVHVICLAKDAKKINARLKRIPEVLFTIANKPSAGTRLSNKHLF